MASASTFICIMCFPAVMASMATLAPISGMPVASTVTSSGGALARAVLVVYTRLPSVIASDARSRSSVWMMSRSWTPAER